jgi:plasmid stabilization system protein ParE
MVKRVIWTVRADHIFSEILEYYIKRNGNKLYSNQLNVKIQSILTLLSRQPFLGVKTSFPEVRVFVTSDFKIFYQISGDRLIILLVWDCRQNPESLELYIKSK